MQVTLDNVHDVVRHHAPDDYGINKIGHIRMAAENMITAILETTPVCADQSAAIRHVREAMMTANAAIVLDGLV
jgi:hypothetical protein